MNRVIIESPFGSPDFSIIRRNILYTRHAVRDSLERGEAPWCSHLFYPQPGILNDHDADERLWGFNAGLAWGDTALLRVVYDDLGVTDGMRMGIEHGLANEQTVEFRQLSPALKTKFERAVEQDPLNKENLGSSQELAQAYDALIARFSQCGIWL